MIEAKNALYDIVVKSELADVWLVQNEILVLQEGHHQSEDKVDAVVERSKLSVFGSSNLFAGLHSFGQYGVGLAAIINQLFPQLEAKNTLFLDEVNKTVLDLVRRIGLVRVEGLRDCLGYLVPRFELLELN